MGRRFSQLREKHPQAYFGGLVALSKVIKWDAAETEMFDKTLSPEEIMDKLEQRVGPEGPSHGSFGPRYYVAIGVYLFETCLEARFRICLTIDAPENLLGNNGPHARTIHNAQSLSAPATVCGLVVYSRLYRPDQCELRRAHHARRSRNVGWHLRVCRRLVLLGLFHL